MLKVHDVQLHASKPHLRRKAGIGGGGSRNCKGALGRGQREAGPRIREIREQPEDEDLCAALEKVGQKPSKGASESEVYKKSVEQTETLQRLCRTQMKSWPQRSPAWNR